MATGLLGERYGHTARCTRRAVQPRSARQGPPQVDAKALGGRALPDSPGLDGNLPVRKSVLSICSRSTLCYATTRRIDGTSP